MSGKNNKFYFLAGVVVTLAIWCGTYLFGQSPVLKEVEAPTGSKPEVIREKIPETVTDELTRLIKYEGKTPVECPKQGAATGVILVIGQSNAANMAQTKVTTKYPTQVFSYFEGKCYVAASPLLGSSGGGGEFITLIADRLISAEKYKNIVLVPAAVSASSIFRWQKEGDLNNMLIRVLSEIGKKYRFTDVIWHQGETEYPNRTTSVLFTRAFNSLLHTLDSRGVNAPVFIGIATKCGDPWIKENPTVTAQRQLIDNKRIFLGADTDSEIPNEDRLPDKCHLAETGQYKTADLFATAILRNRAGSHP